jgi:cytochrome c oxidase subunit 2
MTVKKYLNPAFGAALFYLFGWPTIVLADYGLNMTEGVTSVSKRVYDLHMLMLGVVTVIGIVVFGIMIWSIIHHRKSKQAVAAQFHHNTTIEIIWTIIPIIILVAFAVPATKALIAIEDTSDADMTIKITGYQWKWHYDYLDEGFSFFSTLAQDSNESRKLGSGIDPKTVKNYLLAVDNPVVVPINKKIRLLTTSNDVIHAWWIPELGWKRDAIPGFINDNWTVVNKPGIYRGQCTELCGKDHGYMPIVFKAVAENEYIAWVKEMKAMQARSAAEGEKIFTKDELIAKGEQIYNASCAACHLPTGQGIPGAFPALAGSVIATGSIDGHLNIILNGKAGTAMAAFSGQLSDADIAAVATYERNAWGNAEKLAGKENIVQPEEVKALRNVASN